MTRAERWAARLVKAHGLLKAYKIAAKTARDAARQAEATGTRASRRAADFAEALRKAVTERV